MSKLAVLLTTSALIAAAAPARAQMQLQGVTVGSPNPTASTSNSPPLGRPVPAAAAASCPATGSIFQDSFKDPSGGWEADSSMTFGPTGLTEVIAPTSVLFQEFNGTFFAKDGDFCLDASMPKSVPNTAYAGILFWGTDYNNYYLYQLATNGHAQLYRKVSGNWITIYDQPNAAINVAPGASNAVRVVANQNLMTLYANGQKIVAIRGQAPTGGVARFGLYFQLATAAPALDARTFHAASYSVNAAN